MVTDSPQESPPKGVEHATTVRRPSKRVHDRVLESTRLLFADGGYFALTIDSLVLLSGVSKKTIYRWWSNRAEIALDVIDEAFGAAPVPRQSGSPSDRLRDYLAAEARYVGGPVGALLAGLVADCQQRPDLLTTVQSRYFTRPRVAVRSLLEDAVDAGLLDDATDLDTVASMLLDPIYQALLTGMGPLEPKSLPQRVDYLIDGIRRREA